VPALSGTKKTGIVDSNAGGKSRWWTEFCFMSWKKTSLKENRVPGASKPAADVQNDRYPVL